MDIMTTGVLPQTGEKIVVPDPEPGFDAGTYGGHTTTAAGTGYAQTTQTQQPRLSNGKQFEKADVARTVTKISGAVEVEMGLEDVSLDDRARVCGEFRVISVTHRVDKDGSIVRVQTLAPVADQPLQLVPYDSTNPNDNGIVRMRP